MPTTTQTYNYDPLGGYNTNPNVQQGSGAYGAVPGNIAIPPNIYQQIGTVNPALASQTGSANQTILSELQGELSPETIAALQQNAAQFGVKSGMPGSQFAGNYGLAQLGLNVEKQQRQGVEDYLAMLRGTGATLTPQQLASEIASRNATMAAAPNPRAAAEQQMADWQNKFNETAAAGLAGNPAGGRGGVTISPGGGGGSGGSRPYQPANYGGTDNASAIAAANAAARAEADRARQWAINQSSLPFGNTYGDGGGTDAPYDPMSFWDPLFGTEFQNPGFNPAGYDSGFDLMPNYAVTGFDNSFLNYDPMAGLLPSWMGASAPGNTGYDSGSDSYYNNYGLDSSNSWGSYDSGINWSNPTSEDALSWLLEE